MRADKIKVVDEIWDDARIESFLDKLPMGGEPAEFSKLLHAYRSMRVDDFAIFLRRFAERGGDIQATNNAGKTLSDIIRHHRKSGSFLTLLDS